MRNYVLKVNSYVNVFNVYIRAGSHCPTHDGKQQTEASWVFIVLGITWWGIEPKTSQCHS